MKTVIAALLLLASVQVHSATWHLRNAEFGWEGGFYYGELVGSFTYSEAAGYSDVDVTFVSFDGSLVTDTAPHPQSDDQWLVLGLNARLHFETPLTDAGGTINIDNGEIASWPVYPGPGNDCTPDLTICFPVMAGAYVTSEVPLPAAAWLFWSALIGLALTKLKR